MPIPFCYLNLRRAGILPRLRFTSLFMSTSSLPKRLYQCRIDEVGPLAQMVRSSFVADGKDFRKASPDFAAPNFLKTFDERYDALELLVPTAVRRMSDADVTRTMNKVAKNLRDPLNWLELRVNRAAKKADPKLTVAPTDFGISAVRTKITLREMEGLDGKLKNLLQLIADNADALAAQGHTADDTKVFSDARKLLSGYNVTQNDNLNAQLVLTVENITAANAMWEMIDEILEAGRLMYKETQPRKAVAYTLARLKKRMRQERAKAKKDAGSAE